MFPLVKHMDPQSRMVWGLSNLTSSLLMTKVYLLQPGDWSIKEKASHIMVTHLDPHSEHKLFSGHSEDFINYFQICFVLK